jgi:hypothetical protein
MTRLDPHGAVWTVLVGFASSRPIHPDEHTTRVLVEAGSESEACQLAAQLVGTQVCAGSRLDPQPGNRPRLPEPAPPFPSGRPAVEMVTSTRILSCTV